MAFRFKAVIIFRNLRRFSDHQGLDFIVTVVRGMLALLASIIVSVSVLVMKSIFWCRSDCCRAGKSLKLLKFVKFVNSLI